MTDGSSREIKILITGPMGAGKTTALAAVSESKPIQTEAKNSDVAQHSKSHTTVAMDFGEVHLEGGDRLRIYGTPGQKRFNAMWQILAKGALGVVVLLDMTRPNPPEDLRDYLNDFSSVIHGSCAVVGVGRLGEQSQYEISDLADTAAQMGFAIPVFSVDVRQRQDVLLLLEALFCQIEMDAALAEYSESA